MATHLPPVIPTRCFGHDGHLQLFVPDLAPASIALTTLPSIAVGASQAGDRHVTGGGSVAGVPRESPTAP